MPIDDPFEASGPLTAAHAAGLRARVGDLRLDLKQLADAPGASVYLRRAADLLSTAEAQLRALAAELATREQGGRAAD